MLYNAPGTSRLGSLQEFMGKQKRRDIPRFNTAIIETHCHLDYFDDDQFAAAIERAVASGIEKLITIAVSPDNLSTVVSLTEADPRVWGTQGIHPHEASGFCDRVADLIVANLSHPRILAVGEIGLDYYYDHTDRASQREAFRAQLAIAASHDYPVVIHSREADEDTRAILGEFLPDLSRRGVIHSFTSGQALAEFCLDAGFMLGFNGIVTFNSAQNVRDIVAMTPLEQLLLETDSPYLTPVPYRGRPNEPCYLPFVAEKIAAIKALPTEALLRQTYDNSQRLFFPTTIAES
ncbi:TatD family hydrolase [Chromatocurvus halotolerans]|uniref:TatD DNase family protein n=1 Tax=Chromatocurvus halotolerans TaxID=1132028 RepID=A0A4R2KV15_9GAMM|nr:TatD family hydrolase [Chromatocurvus halotolerans]TCO77663.1 TatD DNase family protein [Chromatocurvus halotolerans]